jgi:signal transduction histidine kinase
MDPEQPEAGGRLRPKPASSSGWPMSGDDRLASVIRAHQERMVDELTSDLWGFDGPWLRRTYPNKAALRLFMEAFVEALRRSFTKRDGKQFVNEYGISLGRRYAEEARDYDDVYNSLIVMKNSLLPFILKADPPIEPLILRLTDVLFLLDHEVARRYYEVEKTRHAQFAELDILKSGFMRLTTHELRRPLSVFRGYVSMIESGDLGEVPADVHKAILKIAVSANEMTKLIDDLAEVGRLEEPDKVLRREPYPVDQLIKDAVDVVRAEALAKKIAIIERIDPSRTTIQVDIDRMRVALQNLLSNAVKYSPPESSVEVRVEPQRGALTIVVEDQGYGIPAEEVPRIFDKYYRGVTPETQNTAGTGLGLYIVKQIAELHGGRVEVVSNRGKGSTFRLRLEG